MTLIKQTLSCKLGNGEASLNIFDQRPGNLSFITLRDFHAFVCKEQEVAFNTVSKACKKMSKKCVDRRLIQELHSLGGLSGISTTAFLYIRTRDLTESLKRVKISDSRIQEVSTALEALQASVYARQSAARQQLAAVQAAHQQPPTVVVQSITGPIPSAQTAARQPSQPRAAPDLSPRMNSGHTVNPLLSLLQYESDTDECDSESVPGLAENMAAYMQAADSAKSNQGNIQLAQQHEEEIQVQHMLPDPSQSPPAQVHQYMQPLQQQYTSIPDIDWTKRCPHLLSGPTTVSKAELAGTPVGAAT